MERKRRPIIAVNVYTGDIQKFKTESDAARGLETTVQAIQASRMWHGQAGEWRFYDTIANMRKRIERIEADIRKLEELGITE